MKKTGGFTLVELLAVVAIIGILSALVVGLAGSAQRNAGRKRAEAEIGQLESFVTDYKTKYGKVPGKVGGTEKECRAALSNALVEASHSLTNMMDPWDEPYRYRATSKNTFYLWSTAGDTGGTNRPAWIGNADPKWEP
ncbi:MAG: type II secretion system protein [Kiritimatiellae bacterium]|nr:type II secretion system protein [Kiritimatiellia bacterium]